MPPWTWQAYGWSVLWPASKKRYDHPEINKGEKTNMNFSASKMLMASAVAGILVCTMSATAFAAELSAGAGTVTASALKLRSEASTASSCITLLPKGTSVVVEDDSIEGWYKVNYEGQAGYLSSDYVSFSASCEAKLGNGLVTGSSVNVRTAASADSAKITMLNKGDVVAITGIDNGWYKISVDGKTGYIRSDYMEVTKKALSSRGTAVAAAASSTKGEEVVSYAKQYLGVRYVYGGSSSKGFDCSGFTMYVAKHFGLSLPHTATSQMTGGYGESIAKSALESGDFVFFCDPSRSNGKACSHCGIYIGNNQFIHASSGGGKVKIDSLSSTYYSKYYVGARRIIK